MALARAVSPIEWVHGGPDLGRCIDRSVVQAEEVADLVDGHILEVDAIPSDAGIGSEGEVAAVEDDIGIQDLAGEVAGRDAGDGDDARVPRCLQIGSGLVEINQVLAVPLGRNARFGEILIAEADAGRGHCFPDLETLAQHLVGLFRSEVGRTGAMQQNGYILRSFPILLHPAEGAVKGLDEKAVCRDGKGGQEEDG